MADPVRVTVMDTELGVITVDVDNDPEGDYGDGAAAGIAALLNILHPRR